GFVIFPPWENALSKINGAKEFEIIESWEADSVVELFRSHGFTDAHIAIFIRKRPSVLLADAEKTLKPKIEYFKSLGMSTTELAKMVTREPRLLSKDLGKQIIPSYNFIKEFVYTDNNLTAVLKRYPQLLWCNVEEVMRPNISLLRTHGVPEPNISSIHMKFLDWYLKIAAVSAMIGASMELFMVKTGFYDKVTVLESEKRAWDNSPEAQALREALDPWRNKDAETRKNS
ncbi:hypothetical protein GIB67_009305, partial [Kingdonia uniflora]